MLALRRDDFAVLIDNGICEQRRVFVLIGKLVFRLDGLLYLIRVRIVDKDGDGPVLRFLFVGAQREERAGF